MLLSPQQAGASSQPNRHRPTVARHWNDLRPFLTRPDTDRESRVCQPPFPAAPETIGTT
ncbi:conserved hypothetical protein [Pseudomonas sp. 8AS]|nr:conserved hypothetical protein [Pseudomonas sp. 8AS]